MSEHSTVVAQHMKYTHELRQQDWLDSRCQHCMLLVSRQQLQTSTMSQVKLLLLATSYGRADPEVPNALGGVADTPIINYFLASLQNTSRLQPLEENVFILANEESYDGLAAWAAEPTLSGGFPVGNIIKTQSSSRTVDVAADVSFAVRAAGLEGCHLMIASLDVLYRPNFNLQRIVEHSLVRAKDTVVFYRPPPSQNLAHHVCLKLDDISLSAPNPRILATDASPSGPADGITAAVLAPIVVIRDTSLPELLQASTSAGAQGPSPASSQTRQLGMLVQQQLLEAGKAVYGLEEDYCIDVSTTGGLAFADGYMRRQLSASTSSGPGMAKQALQQVTRAAQDLSVLPHCDETIEMLLESCSSAKRAFLDFYAEDQQPAAQGASVVGGMGRTGGATQVPERFNNPETWRHQPRKQHPCYRTTGNDYGRKKPSQMEMPDTYAGASQQFSGTFYGGASKVSTMVTSITKSKVHRGLDEF